jgi:hypothetical protein
MGTLIVTLLSIVRRSNLQFVGLNIKNSGLTRSSMGLMLAFRGALAMWDGVPFDDLVTGRTQDLLNTAGLALGEMIFFVCKS